MKIKQLYLDSIADDLAIMSSFIVDLYQHRCYTFEMERTIKYADLELRCTKDGFYNILSEQELTPLVTKIYLNDIIKHSSNILSMLSDENICELTPTIINIISTCHEALVAHNLISLDN